VWTLIPGVPIGCRSPRKRGPYSMPIHTIDGNSSNNNSLVLNVGSDTITGDDLVSMGLANGAGNQSDTFDNKWFRIWTPILSPRLP